MNLDIGYLLLDTLSLLDTVSAQGGTLSLTGDIQSILLGTESA